MSIVLSNATGNVGSALAKKLLDAGESIVVITRDGAKVKHLAERGAKVVVGEIDDDAVLDKAYDGAKVLFLMLPPPLIPNYDEWGASAARKAVAAFKKHKLQRVVYVSSIGAQGGPSTGAIAVHAVNEQTLLSQLRDVTILRPGLYMENMLHDLPTIVSHNTAYSPFSGSPYPVPVVCTADIAGRAAAWLTNEWTGQRTVGVHGAKDITHDDALAIVSKVIGVPIKSVYVTVEQAGDAMRKFGLPDFRVTQLTKMYTAFFTGVAFQAEPRTVETTTPTTVYEWAEQVFKPAYLAAKLQAAKTD